MIYKHNYLWLLCPAKAIEGSTTLILTMPYAYINKKGLQCSPFILLLQQIMPD
ncbi:hypothetical protein CLV62_108111 [Dysgonomonas alginatilytica]|uniref:Uncharacterized protein n=1 Tax=Dysgonomonas alginatilytica TaxID=1605892 RepID=A0A2V3PRW7_9BACT|nr:hypothetical protein CLV62_108111 [Dysgonomonas alginatilytica]